ncbi:MAG: hypothetical protein KF749_03765 [Bacteroidetes bacterium]|nr:hypothetical protein [Bacteroidota bacterium]MCW5897516.1 hypothetical protein [Bacteroidota bacterium]
MTNAWPPQFQTAEGDDFIIGDRANVYKTAVPILKKNSMFSAVPPPEVHRLMAETNGQVYKAPSGKMVNL